MIITILCRIPYELADVAGFTVVKHGSINAQQDSNASIGQGSGLFTRSVTTSVNMERFAAR